MQNVPLFSRQHTAEGWCVPLGQVLYTSEKSGSPLRIQRPKPHSTRWATTGAAEDLKAKRHSSKKKAAEQWW